MLIRINFYVQTFLVGIAILLGLYTLVFDKSFLIWLLYLQALIGSVQLLAALIMLFFRSYRTRLLISYLIAAIVLLIVFALLLGRSGVAIFIVPWLFAAWFWLISFLFMKRTS